MWKYCIIALKIVAGLKHLLVFVIGSFVRVVMSMVVVLCCPSQF